MFANIPTVKPGVIAVSRSCFPRRSVRAPPRRSGERLRRGAV